MLSSSALGLILRDKLHFLSSVFTALWSSLPSLPNALYSLLLDFSHLSTPQPDKPRGKAKDDHIPRLDLFNQHIVYNSFTATKTHTPYLRQCAVSEFDYDFSSPNPYSWDFQNLVLNSQSHSSHPNDNDHDPHHNHHLVKNHIQNVHQHQHQHQPQHQHQHQYQHPHPLRNEYEYDPENDSDSESHLLAKFNSNFQSQLKDQELFQIHNAQQHQHHHHHHHHHQQYTLPAPVVSAYLDSDVESDDDAALDYPLPLDDELMLSFFRSDRNADNYLSSSKDGSPLEDPESSNSSSNSDSHSPIRITKSLKRDSHFQSHDVTDKHHHHHHQVQLLHPRKKQKHTMEQSDDENENEEEVEGEGEVEEEDDDQEDDEMMDSLKGGIVNSRAGEKAYPCTICKATFKVKGYLTRHMKKHATSKPFHCPYFDPSTKYDEHALASSNENENSDERPRCHPTGGFSRRDTFKTHLKAIHFVYPTGTKSGDRSDKKGRCAACFHEFRSNKDWLENHVMTNACEGMLSRYK